MSNLLFFNKDRLKTIARFLVFDRIVGINQHHSEIEEVITYKGKRYKIRAKLTEIKEVKN